ncbi:MAG: hypothetical protein KDD94_12120, partial [Calditrichaeota bacterium]|nr:hypothetical protein [Calditrichota bacterium]
MFKIALFFISFCLVFGQNIKISILDKKNKEAIEQAEVFYGDKLYTTNETGLVLFRREAAIKKVEIKHVSYKPVIFFLNDT